MPASYKIELAKSGRSGCKKCSEKIDKGLLRIGIATEGPGGYDLCKWHHIGCFALPRKLAMSVEEFVDDLLEDTSDDKEILPDRKDEIVTAIEEAGKKGAKGGKGKSSGDKYIDSLKDAYEGQNQPDEDDGKKKKNGKRKKRTGGDDEKEKPAKKAKTGGVSDKELEVYGEVHKMSADALKDILRWNRQILKGNKTAVMHKVIDGAVNGRIAPCGVCGGKLKIDETNFLKVTCNGRFDEDRQVRIPCTTTYNLDNVPRAEPWHMEEPSEEEVAFLDREEAEARGEEVEGAPVDENSDLGKLLKEGKDLELDFSSKEKTRATNKKVIEILQANGSLDLPEDEKKLRQDVGQILIAMKESSNDEILTKLAKEFGFTAKKAAKAQKAEAAISESCKVSANGPLLMAIKELSSLYFKEGNSNAGGTYNKVVGVLKDLDFEVTVKNAKGLGKGKTKVAGIGKKSAELFEEFLKTGTMEKLEEKRANAA
ncbi:poly ADP-ribose polymerase [Seminavis robusta]|uniref:Poly ADP-ribose polymerase n=1 Tax=Seminavis robusta TaxID=568900 RepID=A0A9N8HVI6_9STRA|nr:poly ADP-ribose polymerase [Seminavis robusta]|eukprot:Sro1952_g307470.1 poly ADP-ribose polymerase (483) ;mRNA; f:11764-13815